MRLSKTARYCGLAVGLVGDGYSSPSQERTRSIPRNQCSNHGGTMSFAVSRKHLTMKCPNGRNVSGLVLRTASVRRSDWTAFISNRIDETVWQPRCSRLHGVKGGHGHAGILFFTSERAHAKPGASSWRRTSSPLLSGQLMHGNEPEVYAHQA